MGNGELERTVDWLIARSDFEIHRVFHALADAALRTTTEPPSPEATDDSEITFA